MTLLHRLAGPAAALILAFAMPLAAHAQQAPAEDPAAEAPAEEAPAEDAPAEEIPAEDAPAEETPADEPAPALPAALTNPDIPAAELSLRLIPLTADELGALADEWLGIVQDATSDVVDKQLEIAAADGQDTEALEEELSELIRRRGVLFDRYSSVIDSFEAKGGGADAVAGYRAYRSAVIVEEAQAANWRTWMSRATDWATDMDGGVRLLINVGVVVAAILALLAVAKIARGASRHWFGRVPNLSKLLQSFLALVVYWLVIAFGLMIVLSALGVDVTPLFALVGGASFILAFAMQDTLGNLAAGLMIMINRPFDEGDYVDIAGTAGTVKSVSIVSTTVTTPDNQVIVVPNSKVWGNIITNVTASDTRRVDLVFGIGYDDSIEDAQRVLEETVRAHPMILSDPEPVIRVNSLGTSSVDFICRPWVKSADYWTVYWDLTRQVKEAFDRAGISIPFPQTDMHIHMGGNTASALLPPSAAAAAGSGSSSETVGDTPAQRYAAGDDASDSDEGR